MLTRRLLICVLVGVFSTGALHAQNTDLTEAPSAQRCVRNELTMEFDAKITIQQGDKQNTYPHKAEAKHVFMERLLDVTGTLADKAARYYTTAESTIRFNNDAASKRTLRPERRFLVAQRLKDQIVTFSPHGQLTREEMELTEHLDTMAVAALLPGRNVEVGKTWAIANPVVQALCELDGLTGHNLEGKLESVKTGLAHVKIVGNANGINLGAQVTMVINARLEFDIKAQRIVYLEWKETNGRQQGPITPALNAEVTIKLKRTPIDEPEQLNKFALVPIPTTQTPPANLTNLHHQDAKKRFTLSHARTWHVVSPDDNAQLVMRQVERGEFSAQATITPWKKTAPKNALKLDDFADLTFKTPGWAQDKEIERKQLDNPAKGHHAVYRVVATGEHAGVRTVQYFYLIIGTAGDQLVVTFSVIPQQVQRLGAHDLELVREIAFPE